MKTGTILLGTVYRHVQSGSWRPRGHLESLRRPIAVLVCPSARYSENSPEETREETAPPSPHPWECFTGHEPGMYRLNSIIILDQWDHKVMSSYSELFARAPQLPCQVLICIALVSEPSLRSTQTNTSCAGHIRLSVPLSTPLLHPLSIPIPFLSLHSTSR